jgi:O-antigen/teichoic acid export membrane protein
MASTMIASLTGWIFWIVATHHWPDSQIGVSTSLVAALAVIALMAGQPIATTLLARLPRSDHRRSLLRASCVLSATIALAASLLGVALLPSTLHVLRTPGMTALFAVGSIAMSLGIVLDAAAIAIRQPQTMVIRNSVFGVGKLIVLAVVVYALHSVIGPFGVMVAWTSVATIACAWAARSIFRRADLRATDDEPTSLRGREGWQQLRAGFALQVVGTLCGSLPPQILPLLVIALLGSTSASWFSITWLLGGLCFMISPAVSQALLADASHDPDQLRAKTRFATVVSLAILLVPLLVYVFAGRFVLNFFGATYGDHGRLLLQILAVSAIPDLITNIGVARYRVLNRLDYAALINGSIALVTVGGCVWLLPIYGIAGAGWSWTIGQVFGCVVMGACLALDQRQRDVAVALT